MTGSDLKGHSRSKKNRLLGNNRSATKIGGTWKTGQLLDCRPFRTAPSPASEVSGKKSIFSAVNCLGFEKVSATFLGGVVALRLRVERVTNPPDLRPGLLPVIASRLISKIFEVENADRAERRSRHPTTMVDS